MHKALGMNPRNFIKIFAGGIDVRFIPLDACWPERLLHVGRVVGLAETGLSGRSTERHGDDCLIN